MNKTINKEQLKQLELKDYEFLKDNLDLEKSRYYPTPYTSGRDNEFVQNGLNPSTLMFDSRDVLFVISNPTNLKKNWRNTLNIKLFFPKGYYYQNYLQVFQNLKDLGVNQFKLVNIVESWDKEYVNPYEVHEYKVYNIIRENFIDFFNSGVFNFVDNNKHTLFILKNGSYSVIKVLFQIADGEYIINFGKGSQKSHICSDLEFRLTLYLYGIYNKDFNFLRYSNNFNDLHKSQYTTFRDTTHKDKVIRGGYNSPKLETSELRYKILDINKKRNFHTSRMHSLRSNDYIQDEMDSFTYLDNIKNIIDTSETLEEAQASIENHWLEMMKEKLDNPNSSVWSNITYIINRATKMLENHGKSGILKKRFKVDSQVIIKLKSEIILLTISMMISNNKISSTHLFIQIGRAISYLLFRNYIANSKDNESLLSFENWQVKYKLDTSTDLLKMGNYFAQIFMNEPLEIFTLAVPEDDDDYLQILKVSDKWIDILKDALIIQPTSLPMICKPKPWSETQYGGYINNSRDKKDLIIGSSHQGHEIENLDKTYEVVNIMNSVEFEINKDLLNYIKDHYDILDMDKVDNTTRLQNNITLKLANIYKDLTFYLNVNCDWRGRLYTNSFFLNYQGSDLSRSLLEFKEGEALNDTGLKYLRIFGANCYSSILSKKSYEKRIEWVIDNEDKIISLDREFINNASKKLQFITFCLSYKKYKNNPKSIIKLPVFLDATCSGVQHLAAMLKDVNLAREVNLLESTEFKDAEDIYSTVTDCINNSINAYKDNNRFKDIKLTRKILKVSIMTQVYNVKVSGIFNQLKSKLEVLEKINEKTGRKTKYYLAPTKSGDFIELSYLEVFDIATIISKTIFDIYPPLKDIYSYFINVIKLMLKLSIPIVWITPNGLEITQSYYRSDVIKVKLSYFGKSRTAVIREWKPIIDKNKQSLAIIPNIIHSLDASHLISVVLEGYKNKCSPIITIHDCFGTHPNKMDYLAKIIRDEFIKLYTQEDFLNKYHENVYKSIKDNNIEIHHKKGEDYVKVTKYGKAIIPPKPKTGDLDLSRINNAIYLVC